MRAPRKPTILALSGVSVLVFAVGYGVWTSNKDDGPTTTVSAQQLNDQCRAAMADTAFLLDDGIYYSDIQRFTLAADAYERAADKLTACTDLPNAGPYMQKVVEEVRLAADVILKGDVPGSDAHFTIATKNLDQAIKYFNAAAT